MLLVASAFASQTPTSSPSKVDSSDLAARVGAIVADLAGEGRVTGRYQAHATACGAIVLLWHAQDADSLLEDLPGRIGEPVHVAKFACNKVDERRLRGLERGPVVQSPAPPPGPWIAHGV